ELDPTAGDLTINNGILLDFNTPTMSVFGNNGHTLTINGAISQNTTGSVTLQDQGGTNNIVVFNAANTYTGNTTVNGGELRFGQNGSSNNSTVLLGNGSGSSSATVTMTGASQSLSSTMTVQSGSSGEAILKAQGTNGTTDAWNGQITLNKNLTVADTVAGASLGLATIKS